MKLSEARARIIDAAAIELVADGGSPGFIQLYTKLEAWGLIEYVGGAAKIERHMTPEWRQRNKWLEHNEADR